MKTILTLVFLLSSLTLSARLNKEKIAEAVRKAQLDETQDHFYYLKTENEKIIQGFKPDPTSKVFGFYRLILKGLPPDTRFKLYRFSLLGADCPPFYYNGYVNKDGIAIVKRKNDSHELRNCIQVVQDVIPGEPMFTLVVYKNTYLVAHVVGNPLEATGLEGRHISMEIMCNDLSYKVTGDHFKPHEKITLSILKKNELVIRELAATAEGTFCYFLKDGSLLRGKEQLEIATVEQTNPITLTYNWNCMVCSGLERNLDGLKTNRNGDRELVNKNFIRYFRDDDDTIIPNMLFVG